VAKTKIMVLELEHKEFQNQYLAQFPELRKRYPRTSIKKVTYSKDVDYIVKAKVTIYSYPVSSTYTTHIIADVRVNVDKAELLEDEIKELLKDFARFLTQDIMPSTPEILQKLLNMSHTIADPGGYLPGYDIDIYDSGGEYPEVEIEFRYFD